MIADWAMELCGVFVSVFFYVYNPTLVIFVVALPLLVRRIQHNILISVSGNQSSTEERREIKMEPWVQRLKAAYDAGYYKTEAAASLQTPFPWQNKTCKDCPFWSYGMCQVYADYRDATSHTCSYFDPWNHQTSQNIIHKRRFESIKRWEGWFNQRDEY